MTPEPLTLDLYGSTPVERVLAPTPGRTHRNDLPTAVAAAQKVRFGTGSHMARILRHLLKVGDHGANAYELWQATGGKWHSHADTRAKTLADEYGFTVRTTIERPMGPDSTDKGRVWVLTDAGRDYAVSVRDREAA